MTTERRLFAKEHFDLQLSFAEKVQAISGMPLEQALFEHTNFFVRFGLGREPDRAHAGWQAYVAGLREADDIRDFSYRFYLKDAEASTTPPVAATFGCFAYELKSASVARMHFRPPDASTHAPLAAENVPQRRAELAALFDHMQANAGEHLTVTGASWLYNLNAYRRLFPPAYTESARPLHGRFQRMPLWGQFLDHRGQVKPALKRSFLEALSKQSSLEDLDGCFPFQVLAVQAPARVLYAGYRV